MPCRVGSLCYQLLPQFMWVIFKLCSHILNMLKLCIRVVKGSSQHQVGGEWFEIELGKISRMLVKYEVLPIPNVIAMC